MFKVNEGRIDVVPANLQQVAPVLYRMEVTEAQLDYLHALVIDIDEGENAQMPPAEFDRLHDVLEYHHKGIHGPEEA